MDEQPSVEQESVSSPARDVVMKFVSAVNDRQIEKMTALMPPEHRFTDTLGVCIEGRMAAREAWQGYFRIVPDFKISISEFYESEEAVVMVGTASGTYSPKGCRVPGNQWSMPAAWRAVVEDGRIREWQIIADNEPLRARMRRSQDKNSE